MKKFVLRSIGIVGALSLFGTFGACGGESNSTPGAAGGSGGQGGAGGTGGDGGPQCATITFDSPKSGTTLSAQDDKDKDNCANGFQYDVTVSTDANDGVTAKLYANNNLVTSTSVSGGKAVFTNVSFDSFGSTVLKVQIGAQSCYQTSTVSVSCGSSVSCSISKPVISPTHPALNGVPASEGGDRASAAGNPYQVAFEVSTNAESGSTVSLEVDKKADAKAQVGADGKAKFAGVTLMPDGDHLVKATCKALSGSVGTSAEAKFPVDTQAPDLAVTGLANDAVKTPADDMDSTLPGIQFEVCGSTTASDATDLPSSLGSAQNNFCVKAGSAQASCVPAVAGKACVKMDCGVLGSAAQKVTATLKDAAGNPKVLSYANVKCDTANPTVVIVDPVAYDPASSSPVILNKSKDADPAVYGLQYTVTACTNAPAGSKASLQHKAPQQPASPIGAEVDVVAAQSSDNCPAGLPNVAKWPGVTLAESSELADGTLVEVTRLRADVAVAGTTYSSVLTDEWVDTTAPGPYVVNFMDPVANQLVSCGALIQSLEQVTTTVRVGCDQVIPVAVRVQHDDTTVDTTSAVVASGIVDLAGAILKTGLNTITAIATEPSGNEGQSAPCQTTVGKPPALVFVTPTNSALFNLKSTDADPATPGFQSEVRLSTDDNAHDVTLTVQGTVIGTLTPSGGQVVFANVTLPDADALQIKATQVGANGTASPQITVRVDTHAPTAATSPTSAVADRRAASVTLGFNAPSDFDPLTNGTRAAAQYEMRYLEVAAAADCSTAMTDATFSTGLSVNPGGGPVGPGLADTRTVNGLKTGRSYCVGLRGRDSAQNDGPVVAFPLVAPAWLNSSITPPGPVTSFGRSVLGGIDIDGDSYDDLLVGSEPNSVWIYFGSANGIESSPKVRIIGPAGGLFGWELTDLGNFDGSTESPKPLPEFGVAAPILNGQGALFVFSLPKTVKGSALTTLEIGASGNAVSGGIPAHFTIIPDGTAGFNGALLGFRATSIGDFDGDLIDDIVVPASKYSAEDGRAYLLRGRQTGAQSTLVMPQQCEVELVPNGTKALFGSGIAPLGNSGLPSVGGKGGFAASVSSASGGAGQVFAFSGRFVAMGAHAVWNVDQEASATVTGPASAQLGGLLTVAGDVDGDGYTDLLSGNQIPSLNMYSTKAFILYGGPSSWGTLAEIDNDVGVAGDYFPFKVASPPLANLNLANLDADSRAEIAFTTLYSNGVGKMTAWVVSGRQKLQGSSSISAIGVRPGLPSDVGMSSLMTLAPNAAGNDSWADVLIGDASATGGGRVIVLY